MANCEPPAVTLVWCPECGRTDRFTSLPMRPRKHFAVGADCKGTPIRVQYAPVRQQPLRGRSDD